MKKLNDEPPMAKRIVCVVGTVCSLVSICGGNANAEKEKSLPSTEVRKSFVRDCARRGVERGDDTDYVNRFRSCSFDVLANGMTLAEYMEVESAAGARNLEQLPRLQRLLPKLRQCKK